MDGKEAKKLLKEHKDALEKLLGDDLKDEAIKHAKGAKLAKKTFIDRIKEFPVVEKVTSLGTAGTVAVSTAAVTQTDLAVNYTEIVVAQVAEDVYTGVIEPPGFIDAWVDFDDLHVWGQDVIADKIAEIADPTPQVSSVVENVSSDVVTEVKPETKVETVEESKPSIDEKETSQDDKEETSEETDKESTEDNKESQDKTEASEEIKEEPKEEVKLEIPRVETPKDDTITVSPIS